MAGFTIGNVHIAGRFIMAPMAGVTDRAFRQICRECGAAMTVSEMISTQALLFQDRKTRGLLSLAPNETPGWIQIFGSNPDYMAAGARKALDISGAALVDINMGCPAPKIVKGGDGSALMNDPALAARIIRAVVEAVDVPVTVKFRKGWDEEHQNYLDFAKMAEDCGAAAVTLHGRTRAQMYAGRADWAAIAAVKRALSIPVIANGDVMCAQDAQDILRETGADAVMIGRGALGNPWLFAQCAALDEGRAVPPLPPLPARMQTVRRQIELAAQHKGERIALLEARKHFAWYLKGVRGTKKLKARISALTSFAELDALLAEASGLEEGHVR
ncbi:MAG TPA: tRNA dihydrouridine synthase DusB [Candidatus Butyricicoccus stercorigallinarum]|nr:tRNA dihydrouridine synthase DusB [Candidatus Butyricicoccus stercorigallinarum]